MNLLDIFYLNEKLAKEHRFTREQWTTIVDEAFSHGGEWSFDWSVESFYTCWLGFDYTDREYLITDIQHGDGDAFEQFIDDIMYYFS